MPTYIRTNTWRHPVLASVLITTSELIDQQAIPVDTQNGDLMKKNTFQLSKEHNQMNCSLLRICPIKP